MRDGVLVGRIRNRCGGDGDRCEGGEWPMVKTKSDLILVTRSNPCPDPEPHFRLR